MALVALAAGALGCMRTTGSMSLGAVGPGTHALSVMRLRPDAVTTSCRRSFAGLGWGQDVDDPVARLLASDPEANVLAESTVEWTTLSLGPYGRHCVTIRGAPSRTIRTVTIPSDPATPGHHHH